MCALAVYETFTPAEKRAIMGETIRRREMKDLGGSTLQEAGPSGNVMVHSTQKLSGQKKSQETQIQKAPIAVAGQSQAEETESRGWKTTHEEDTRGG